MSNYHGELRKYLCELSAVFAETDRLASFLTDMDLLGATLRELGASQTEGKQISAAFAYVFENGWGPEYTQSKLTTMLDDRGGQSLSVVVMEV